MNEVSINKKAMQATARTKSLFHDGLAEFKVPKVMGPIHPKKYREHKDKRSKTKNLFEVDP